MTQPPNEPPHGGFGAPPPPPPDPRQNPQQPAARPPQPGHEYGQPLGAPAYGQPPGYGQPPQGTPQGGPASPYGQPQPGPYGAPQQPGPYGQPQQAPGPYQQPGPYGAQQPTPYGQPQPPYGGYPAPPGGGRGQRRTALIVGAVVAALLVISGGVYLATRDDDGDGKKPVAQPSTDATVTATPSTEPSGSPTEARPSDDAYPSPSASDVPDLGPTGTGIEGVWRSSKDGRMLAMAKSTQSGANRGGAALVKGDLSCKGLREERTPGKTWRLALLCERGGKQDKSLGGDVTLNGDTVTVDWDSEATETFDRFQDLTGS
ncbi:hypothetical protein H8N00_20165 [Streptomyces sp. AC563]|uniref:hypothetical protein n=1 Tax=Streptomyces buecherae TaxID=2763006 RepID=UPI00164E5285|nr:hypothetical protein [Streptomyces buecherae]